MRTELKKALDAKASDGFFYDRLVAKKDGTFEVKRHYFYHHGQTAQWWAERVQVALKLAGAPFEVVGNRDDWRAWPKDSYLVAVVRATQERKEG